MLVLKMSETFIYKYVTICYMRFIAKTREQGFSIIATIKSEVVEAYNIKPGEFVELELIKGGEKDGVKCGSKSERLLHGGARA